MTHEGKVQIEPTLGETPRGLLFYGPDGHMAVQLLRVDPPRSSASSSSSSVHRCLKSQETTPLETDLLEYKFYAPNVGNVLEVDAVTGDRVELVEIRSE